MNSMKNVAVVVAGGSGTRMGQDIPKQFINVFDKPVLIYTLESFQRHPDVDAIAVVCIDGWQTMVDAYAKQFNIDKLQWIVPGGGSVQESIRNGVEHLEHELDPEDIVIIHDGIHGSSYTNTMMVDLGETLHFAKGSDKNIKLTTKGDLELFKAYITADEDTWLK